MAIIGATSLTADSIAALDGLSFTPDFSAGDQATNVTYNAATGTYTIAADTVKGISFADQSAGIDSTNVTVNYPGSGHAPLLDYNFNFTGGGSIDIQSIVVGYNQNAFLVEQLLGFATVDNGVTFVNVPVTGFYIFSDKSLDKGAVSFPLVFGQSGPNDFGIIPEPSGAALMAVAVVGFLAARLRRRFV